MYKFYIQRPADGLYKFKVNYQCIIYLIVIITHNNYRQIEVIMFAMLL